MESYKDFLTKQNNYLDLNSYCVAEDVDYNEIVPIVNTKNEVKCFPVKFNFISENILDEVKKKKKIIIENNNISNRIYSCIKSNTNTGNVIYKLFYIKNFNDASSQEFISATLKERYKQYYNGLINIIKLVDEEFYLLNANTKILFFNVLNSNFYEDIINNNINNSLYCNLFQGIISEKDIKILKIRECNDEDNILMFFKSKKEVCIVNNIVKLSGNSTFKYNNSDSVILSSLEKDIIIKKKDIIYVYCNNKTFLVDNNKLFIDLTKKFKMDIIFSNINPLYIKSICYKYLLEKDFILENSLNLVGIENSNGIRDFPNMLLEIFNNNENYLDHIIKKNNIISDIITLTELENYREKINKHYLIFDIIEKIPEIFDDCDELELAKFLIRSYYYAIFYYYKKKFPL